MQKKIWFLSGAALALGLFVIIGWYLYAPALNAPFVFDDVDNIVNNPHIRLNSLSPEEIIKVLRSPCVRRPLANTIFAFNYYFGRYDVSGYHVVNLAIHIFTAFIIFLVAHQTFGVCGVKSDKIPFLAGALWLVNPVHTQSVTYIVQRMNALSAMFVLLALCCYIQARKIQITGKNGSIPILLMTAAAFSGLCGLASKETAAILPVVIFLYEWFFFQNLDRAWIKRKLPWIGVITIIMMIVALVYMDGNPVEKLSRMYEKRGFTLGQRLLTEPRVILYYLTLLFFPFPARLNLDYNFPLSVSLIKPASTLPAILALAALVALAVYMAKKHRLAAFAVLWFLVTLAIESSFIGLALIFEHRTYLPFVFPVIALTYILFRRIKAAWITALILIFLITLWGYGTLQRNRTWSERLVFWQDCNAKSPNNPRILNNLGLAYKEINHIEAARQAFHRALDCDPEWIGALNNLGTIALEQNKPEEALSFFDKAIQIEPDYYNAHYNRGLALLKLGRPLQAIAAFRETLKINPFYEDAHNNLGAALMQKLQVDQAIDHFRYALKLNPYYEKAFSNLGIAYCKKGLTDEAVASFNRALDIDPYYLEAYNNMKRVKGLARKHERAIYRLKRKIKRQKNNPGLHFRLGETYNRAGMTQLALEQYEKALSLQPEAVDCLNVLGGFYAAHYRYQEAADMFERLSRLLPRSALAYYNLACIYALQNKPQKAITALKAAVDNGYDNWGQIATDKDLENIHDMAYFIKILNNHGLITGE